LRKNGSETNIKTFSYKYSIFYNSEYKAKKKVFCFYSKEMKQIAKKLKKPSLRICVFKNGNKILYYMGNDKRYVKSDKYKLNLINMNFLIQNTKYNNRCENSAFKVLDFNKKISQCLEKLKK